MDNQSSILKNSFGLNIAIPKQQISEVKKAVEIGVENLSKSINANPFVDYFETNDKVFSGEVAREIESYHAQIYTLGQVMREGEPGSTFNASM